MPTHKLSLEMHKRTSLIPQQVVVRQGETATQTIEAEVLNDGVAYTSSCSSARLDILRADGKWSRVTATKSSGKVTCTLPSAALSSPGLCRLAHFVFYTGTSKIETTEGFELRILPAVDTSDASQESQNYDDQLQKLYEKWAEYEQQAEKNEQARISAENSRVSAENTRNSNETARQNAESTRVSNENARKSQETARVNAENTRKSQETARQSAESTRQSQESTRQSQEATRLSQEAARVTAEKNRESEFNTLKSQSQNATNAANGAASNANNAATYAQSVAANLQSSVLGDDDVAQMKEQIDKLGSMLADSSGDFYYMDGTIYAPKAKASVSGTTVTLGSTCSASGTTIKLA